jgi:hypothetical protein
MAVVVDGAEPGISFEYEIVIYSEFTGATFGMSKSHSDTPGMSFVRDSLPNGDPAKPTETLWDIGYKALQNSVLKEASIKYILPAAMKQIGL